MANVPLFLSSVSLFHPPVFSGQGAAFGFHMIATKAGEQLAPFLPQLVPRLYRYQFDPNLSIRQAMTSIWDAVVTDKTLVGVDDFACTKTQDKQMDINIDVFSLQMMKTCFVF